MKIIKWFILFAVLSSDFLILAALGYLFCVFRGALFIPIILAILTYCAWKHQGGFSHWKPSRIRAFLRNWDNLG